MSGTVPTSTSALSPVQQGMLFHTVATRTTGVYVAQVTCRLAADLDVPAFEHAWQRAIDRHDSLRASFDWEGGAEPVQNVHARVGAFVDHQDWRALDARDVRARLDADRRAGFDLRRPPLMRLTLARLAEGRTLFVWTHHQLLLDGRSRVIVLREVDRFYDAYANERELELPAPVRPGEYVAWLRRQEVGAADEYWRRLLGTFASPATFTGSSERDPAEHRTRAVDVPHGLQAALHELARRHRVTVNIVVQCAWAVLLSRYTGQRDIVFGATRSCRRSGFEGAASIVGVLMNTLPHRLLVDPAAPFAALLEELRRQHVAMRDHQHTPLIRIREGSALPNTAPLFETIVVFDERDLHQALRAEGAALWGGGIHRSVPTHYPLTLTGYTKPTLRLEIDGRRDVFDDPALGRLAGHFATLLAAIAANPRTRCGELPLVTDAERQQMRDAWEDVRRDVPALTLPQMFEAQAARTPDHVAALCEDVHLTYRELNERANRLTHVLTAAGIGAETIVAVAMPRSIDLLVALLATLKAGAAYLPLDPEYPAERLAFMIADAQPACLLHTASVAIDPPPGVPRVVVDDAAFVQVLGQQGITSPTHRPPPSPDTAAYVIYTSGSTGAPKGVVVSHRSIVNKVCTLIEYLGLSPATRFAATSAVSFDPLLDQLFCPLCAGGATVIVPDRIRDDVARFREYASRHGITVLNGAPVLIARLCAGGDVRVDTLMVGADVFPGDLARQLHTDGAARRVLNLYGPTETCINASAYEVPRAHAGGAVPIGSALPNYRLSVRDAALNLQPMGVADELYIGGCGLARGYLRRPALTAERFVPDPDGEPGARLYRTGDVATRRADGQLEFHGRRDTQIKIRGFRIEPAEIEQAIERHPAVHRAVAAVSIEAAEHKRLIAYVTMASGAEVSSAELRAFLARQLPGYMVPALFVSIDAFPLTPTGKIDRAALPPLEQEAAARRTPFVLPRTPLEQLLAAIWIEVLGVSEVGVYDNFFELGGHSLSAMQVVSRARERTGVELSVSDVLVDQTIDSLAKTVEPLWQGVTVEPRA